MPDRLVALLVDAIALTVLVFLAAAVVGVVFGPLIRFHDGAGSIGDAVDVDRGVAAVDALVAAGLAAAYFIGSWRRGGSPGQRLLGLAVDGYRDDSPPALTAAALRWLALVAPFSLASVLDAAIAHASGVWGLAGLWYLLLLVSTARGPSGRGWHDRLAGTTVTRSARPVMWGSGAGEDTSGDR